MGVLFSGVAGRVASRVAGDNQTMPSLQAYLADNDTITLFADEIRLTNNITLLAGGAVAFLSSEGLICEKSQYKEEDPFRSSRAEPGKTFFPSRCSPFFSDLTLTSVTCTGFVALFVDHEAVLSLTGGIAVHVWAAGGALAARVEVPGGAAAPLQTNPDLPPLLNGLLGNLNADPADDLTDFSGTVRHIDTTSNDELYMYHDSCEKSQKAQKHQFPKQCTALQTHGIGMERT